MQIGVEDRFAGILDGVGSPADRSTPRLQT